MVVGLGGDVLERDEVHAVFRRSDEASGADPVERAHPSERDWLVDDDDGARVALVDGVGRFDDFGVLDLISWYVAARRYADLDEDGRAGLAWTEAVLPVEQLAESDDALGNAFRVVESLDAADDVLEALCFAVLVVELCVGFAESVMVVAALDDLLELVWRDADVVRADPGRLILERQVFTSCCQPVAAIAQNRKKIDRARCSRSSRRPLG